MSAIVSGEIRFGRVPREHWVQPDWIDEKKAADYRSKLMEVGIIYGDNVAYRNMCRFNSGVRLIQRTRYLTYRLGICSSSTDIRFCNRTSGTGGLSLTSSSHAISTLIRSTSCRTIARRMASPLLLTSSEKPCRPYGMSLKASNTLQKARAAGLTSFADFIRQHPEFVAEDNGAMFVSDNDSDGYNLCHCDYIFSFPFGSTLLTECESSLVKL
jgi:hypothetical protein